MSHATNPNERTEQQIKADAELAVARKNWRENMTAETSVFQQENYEIVAGTPRRYVGATNQYDGTTEVTIAEWTTVAASVRLTRDEILVLIDGLQKLVK